MRAAAARRVALIAALAVVAASLTGCGDESADARADGTPVDVREIHTAAALPSAASTTLVTYTSTGSRGDPITVTGTVSTPRTAPPDGGWPVVSWAHGTTGYADACAPSQDTPDGPDHDYLGPVTDVLDQWVRRGYVVVQTDYEGLGVPGGHPYINAASEANTVIDMVRAARATDERIGARWVVAGHSQGGQAALYTAQTAGDRAPELDLRGAIAIAPGGVDLDQTVDFIRQARPGSEAAQAFLPLIVLGAEAAEPSIRAEALLTDAMAPSLDAARTGCLAQTRSVAPVPSDQVFRPGADVDALTDYLAEQDPRHARPRVPVLVAQGTADVLAAKPGTDRLVDVLCGRGAEVTYRVYDGADHRASVSESWPDAEEFASTVLAGQRPVSTCRQ